MIRGPYSNRIDFCARHLSRNDTTCETFQLENQDRAFDVDMSRLPWRVTDTLYFADVDAGAGESRFLYKAGSAYCTAYSNTYCGIASSSAAK